MQLEHRHPSPRRHTLERRAHEPRRPTIDLGWLRPVGFAGSLLCLLVGCSEGRRIGAPDGGGGNSMGNAGSSSGGNAGTGSSEPLPESCLASGQVPGLQLTSLVTGLDAPVFATSAPGDSARLYIIEQSGRVRVFENGALVGEPFLDLSARLTYGGEQGLLGLAFHPEYADNGRFFVHYSSAGDSAAGIDNGDGVISEFRRSADSAARADAGSERRVITIPQPYDNHNGGMLAFSPQDGFLYAAFGDGGSANDPQNNGQNLGSWLGKMLRLDVDAIPAGRAYGIPAGNMTGGTTLPEIWSYGWRNPWRFSFDSCTGDLYVGDVGQGRLEEIDYEPAGVSGRNYGWKVAEGSGCLSGDTCDTTGMTPPVLDYPRSFGNSVTGGYVYRGAAIPGLRGYYLYADYSTGNIGRFRIESGAAVDAQDITDDINPDGVNEISSFGVDASGEMLVVDRGGTIYRIEAD